MRAYPVFPASRMKRRLLKALHIGRPSGGLLSHVKTGYPGLLLLRVIDTFRAFDIAKAVTGGGPA